MTPAIGSKWRSKRTGRVVTIEEIEYVCQIIVGFRMRDGKKLRCIACMLGNGRPCGYEAVNAKEVERNG